MITPLVCHQGDYHFQFHSALVELTNEKQIPEMECSRAMKFCIKLRPLTSNKH